VNADDHCDDVSGTGNAESECESWTPEPPDDDDDDDEPAVADEEVEV
jgi:hypothetical protein